MEVPVAYNGNEPYIFLSYSHADEEPAFHIISKLNENGYRVWYDDGITPGSEWDYNIAKHINECAFFISLISENYLNSDNCRDELNFVRDKNKPRILIYLEDVQLPDEMQMRLNRLQALFFFKYKNRENRFFEKLFMTPQIKPCQRELPKEPLVKPVKQSEHSVPDIEGNRARDHIEPDIAPSKDSNEKKSNRSVIIGIAVAAIVALAVIIGIIAQNTGHKIESDKANTTKTEKTSASQDNKSLSGGMNVLLGTHISTDDYSQFKEMQTLDYNGDTYEVALLPFYVNAGYSELDDICLGFYDDRGDEYYFYGKYTLSDDTLSIKEGGSAEELPKEAVPLKDSLTYNMIVHLSALAFSSGDQSTELANTDRIDGKLILKGKLSDGSEAFENVQSIDLDYDYNKSAMNRGEVVLTDGRTANELTLGEMFLCTTLTWPSETVTKNGKTVTEDLASPHEIDFYYINNYPYGFTLVYDEQCYYYQN